MHYSTENCIIVPRKCRSKDQQRVLLGVAHFLCNKTCKNNISINIWSVQHPKASQNMQHMPPPPPLMSLLEVHLSKSLILLKKLLFSPPKKIISPTLCYYILFFRKSEFLKSLNISGQMSSLTVPQNSDKQTCFCYKFLFSKF